MDLCLFDMEADTYETTNVLERFPGVAGRMRSYAEDLRRALYQEVKQ